MEITRWYKFFEASGLNCVCRFICKSFGKYVQENLFCRRRYSKTLGRVSMSDVQGLDIFSSEEAGKEVSYTEIT